MTNEQLQAHVKSGGWWIENYTRKSAKWIECNDGFTVSVQASDDHFCIPRNLDGPYTHFELAYPSEIEYKLLPYSVTRHHVTESYTVYAEVPVNLVLYIINNHGGVKEFV